MHHGRSRRATAVHLHLIVAIAALAIAMGIVPASAAVGPKVTVSIVVDRVLARPGDAINYSMRVENIGDQPAQRVQVSAHIPAGTTEDNQNCPEGTFEPDGDICLAPDAPAPGLGEPVHQVGFGYNQPLPPGAGFTVKMRVTVDEGTAVGTHLPNHAHADVPLQPTYTSAPVDTLVVGTLPKGLFGSSATSASGGLVTDSFDSSAGTYAQTATPAGGHISSNGDILVAGGSLIQGDATPGPGRTTTVSNNSVVTGSTAPAASSTVLNAVNALAYATVNDNARICRAPGSCVGNVAYNDAAKTLRIEGTITLGPGAYYFCSMDALGTINVSGPVTIWLGPPSACGSPAKAFRSGRGARINTGTGKLTDFQVRAQGASGFLLDSHATLRAILYGAESHLALEGGSELFGQAVIGTVTAGAGGGRFHLDRSALV